MAITRTTVVDGSRIATAEDRYDIGEDNREADICSERESVYERERK